MKKFLTSKQPSSSKLPQTGVVVGSGLIALLGATSVATWMVASRKKKK
ncbi:MULTISPECIES: LPXTG cell wall anchor domain-containing protein [unclassified Clostridium]|nr:MULTISPECIES: LPXTG cell wall anchor domain-containing protein [unclassified Clostridium]MBO5131211.1 LPXTG cell wall anchor domain-containing protein [Romboutsia sp.]MBP3917128.1 LPXTG cell wall anchor domain-containing protein [Clostridium sp.]MEE0933050.1 LPXTG cell wall anchor domain-containing protein [Clostridium sp.]